MARATDSLAGVVAHTESADRHVASAVPHANPTGKVYLTAATDEHNAVLTDAAKARKAMGDAQNQIGALTGEITRHQDAYQHLESRWFVRWGRWIERMLWIIGITWLVLGATSVVLGMGNPLSLTWRIGKEITRLLPIMNIFSWVRDWILTRRAAVSVTTSTAVSALAAGQGG